jgi:hypothetical protein
MRTRMCVKLGNPTGEPTHVFDVAGRGRVVVVCFWFTFARVEMDVDSASLK